MAFLSGKREGDALIIGINLAFIKADFHQRISTSIRKVRRRSIVLLGSHF